MNRNRKESRNTEKAGRRIIPYKKKYKILTIKAAVGIFV